MDNFKYLTFLDCDVLNKNDTIVSIDLFKACERNLQDFSLSQKIGVIPQTHSTSYRFSPTKPKIRAIWVRKNLQSQRLMLNSFNCLWTCFVSFFGCFVY